MIERMFDDQFPFAIRAQLAHLFRVLYVSPQLVSAATNPVRAVLFIMICFLYRRSCSCLVCCSAMACHL